MWSLSRILGNPEVTRIYVGSFWNQPLQFPANRDLFEAEQEDLFDDLQGLPRFATIRRLNDLIKRARLAKVHAHIIAYLKKQMPMIGKDSKKKDMIKKLDQVFTVLMTEHKIPKSDFPDVNLMRKNLERFDFSKFNSLDQKMLDKVDQMLAEDIPRLMSLIPHEEREKTLDGKSKVVGGVFTKDALPIGTGINEGIGEAGWVVDREKHKYDEIFSSLEQSGGKVTGNIGLPINIFYPEIS